MEIPQYPWCISMPLHTLDLLSIVVSICNKIQVWPSSIPMWPLLSVPFINILYSLYICSKLILFAFHDSSFACATSDDNLNLIFDWNNFDYKLNRLWTVFVKSIRLLLSDFAGSEMFRSGVSCGWDSFVNFTLCPWLRDVEFRSSVNPVITCIFFKIMYIICQ